MLYSNKIKPYSFVNPNLITVPKSGMASAVKSGGGVASSLAQSSRSALLGLNRLGASLQSLGETQRQIRDVVSIQLKTSKDVKAFKLKRKQYLRDQESERKTELAGQKKGEVVDKEEVKKEGEKKLSWLEKLLGPFRGIVEFALRTIITQGILRWVSDPKNGERLGKIVTGLSKFFGFVFGIVSWSIGSFMSGISNVFGDGSKGGLSRFAEVLGGLGQILIGIAGLKAAMYLLNPFSLIGDILGLVDVLSTRDTSGGADVPTDKPDKPGKPSVGPQRNALTKFGRNALVGTLGKGGAKSALTFFKKTVSPVLKKIPIIGGLIDFAINVFVFKESPGKAAFKAIGAGLLTWLGGAIGSVIPGPGTFVGALLGGMAGDALGGLLYDAIFGKSKKDDEPALAEGGLITKPTRAIVGEKGPELILPLGMLSSATGVGSIVSTIQSALTGALSAMGSSGELAKQVIADDLAEMQKQSGGARPAQPGESLGKSVIKTSGDLSDLELGSDSDGMGQYIGDKSSYGNKSSRDTLRGSLANILGVFESISKKSFSTGSGGFGGGGGGTTSSDMEGPSSFEATEWKKDPEFASAVNDVAKYFNIRANDLLGLMASESGLRPNASNGTHVGLIQFSASAARGAGTSQSELLKMTRAQQMPYVKKYLMNAGLPKGATAGHLYTAVFLPAFVKKPADFVIADKDGSLPSGYPESRRWYSSNSGLDMDKDGKLTISELGRRIDKKKREFGIPMAVGGKLPLSSEEYKEKWSGDGRDEMPKKFSAGGKAIVEGAKKIIGKGRGSANECANTTRAALRAAGHPAANKTTSVGDLDIPKGSSYSKGLGFAASFGGTDMGTIIKDKSQVKAGDILLWKADRNLGGSSNKGAITHVGIAADDGLKHQYDHNVSRGFHYRPHWHSSSGTSWFAAVRLGGSGTIGPGEVPSSSSTSSATEEKEMSPEEQIKSIISKMTADIMKLNAPAETDNQSVIKSSPAAVKPVANPKESLDKLSATTAAMEEDSKTKTSIVPIPTAINSGSAASPVAQPTVVRPRTPITYGF